MNSRLIPFLVTFLFSTALFAQDYEIKFNRPDKVGDQYHIDATLKQLQEVSVTSNGNPVKSEKKDITAHCEGVFKILEVDNLGRQTKTAFTIDKFTKTDGGVDSEVLPKGTVVNSSVVDKKSVHEINGQPVGRETSGLLGMVISLSKGNNSDDEVFGSKERKKKGDTWDINAELAKQGFLESTGGGKIDNLTGKTTLDDVEGDALKLSSTLSANFQPPLPPTITVDSSSMNATFGGLFPIDTTKYVPEESIDIFLSIAAHGDGPSGEKIVMNMKTDMKTVRKLTLVK